MEEEESIETMMSDLPPETLRQIVSLIPLKEAVRTCTLSSSWKSLWTPIQVTSDDYGADDNDKINRIVGLLSKSSSVPELWRFSLQMGKREKPLFFSAAKGGGGELHLDFFEKGREIQSNFNLVFDPNTTISNLCSIKTLHLSSVNKIADNLVSTLFSSCLFLESLKMEKCSGSIDIKASNSLKSFEMVGCQEIESIAISAPNLKSFWYRGALPPLIKINGCLNLVDVVLDLREGFGRNDEFDCEDVLNLLSSIKDVEILKISGWLLEWLCAAGVVFERLPFKFNKLKDLCWFDASMNQAKRDSLACFLHITPQLEKLFVKMDQNLSPITCPYFHQLWHEPHMWVDYETVTSHASQLEHLKLIQLEGFKNEEDDQLVMLMNLLLRHSVALKSMTVILPDMTSRQVVKIPKSQLKQTSACQPERIVISSPNEGYFFVLIEGGNKFL